MQFTYLTTVIALFLFTAGFALAVPVGEGALAARKSVNMARDGECRY